MKVLRLTPHFYYTPDVVDEWIVRMDQMGGMQMQIYRQALALAKNGINQVILPITMPNAPKKWIPVRGVEVIKGNISMIPIKSKVRGTLGLNFYWGVGVLKHLINYKIKGHNFDLVHVHCSGVMAPLIIGVIAKKLLKKPLIYTVHCCRISTYHPMSKLDTAINSAVIDIEKYCLKKATQIIVLTNRTSQIIQKEYQIDKNKLSVIPDIIDYDDFTKDLKIENIEKFKSKYHISDDEIIISYVGRIAYEKGCFVLFDAFLKLKNDKCKLFFFGDGNERLDLEKRIKKFDLDKKCVVLGYLPNNEIPFAIACSSFMAMPSLHEEFGSLLLEIAAVGKTVVASDAGGIPEIVKDGENGLIFHVGDSDMLLKKLNEAISNIEKIKKYGVRLRKEVRLKYVFKQNIQRVIQIYKKVRRGV